MRLSEILIESARNYPEKRAVEYLGRSLTYAELLKSVSRTANALWNAGVRPGENVCIICRNGLQYIEAMFAISFVGAAPALINTRMSPIAICQMVEQTGARLAFVSNTETATRAKLEETFGDRLQIVVTAHDPALPSNYGTFVTGQSESFTPVETAPDANAVVMFTSGTTGKAKGVAISDRAVRNRLAHVSDSDLWHSDDVFLCVAPLCHAISISVMVLLNEGGTLLLCPPEYVRDIHKVLEIIG